MLVNRDGRRRERYGRWSVTKDIYGHLTAERIRAGADAMDAALRDAKSVS